MDHGRGKFKLELFRMKNILDQQRVLVLNNIWMAIGVKNVRDAFSMMCADAATAVLTDDGSYRCVKWEEWVTLPLKSGDLFVSTSHAAVKVPKIIVAVGYEQIPKKSVPLTLVNLWKKYGKKDCYTMEDLALEDASMEHLDPKSKGGLKTWDNILPAHKKRNNARGHKTHVEFGMFPRMRPSAPLPVPTMHFIENHYNIPEWDKFLPKKKHEFDLHSKTK